MAKRREKRSCRPVLLEPNAAGIDVGAEEIYVAVPPDRDEESVRKFSSFTCDLHALADWLIRCRIRTVAMESTGVYWIPLFQILETRGIEVFLVNAQYLKSVPGRKSDVSDCQWIQYLHSVGLLKASFRPPGDICAIRSLWRHRGSLLQMAAEHIMHIQKSLSQMNLQIHHVLSDITGVSGQAILDAILAGERDPMQLAQLCNWRVKSPRATVAKALEGDYRPEHLFTLKQSLDGYRYYQKLIAELDREIERLMQLLPSAADGSQLIPSRTKHSAFQRQGNDPSFNLRKELYRIAGVDLTDIPGVSAVTAQVVLTEIGTDVSRFRNASAFASWLGLCPEKRVSGGKVLSCKTRKVKNRAAIALRLGANSLCRAKGYFGEFFRRMRAKLGTAQAITATAHKIARVLYHVLLLAFQLPAPDFVLAVFKGISHLAPHAHILHLKNETFSRDPNVVQALNEDPLVGQETQPSQTMAAMVRADARVKEGFPLITLPVLILHGTLDKNAKPAGSQLFYDTTGSTDKTLKLYEGSFHDPLNDLDKEVVMEDIKGWINARIPAMIEIPARAQASSSAQA